MTKQRAHKALLVWTMVCVAVGGCWRRGGFEIQYAGDDRCYVDGEDVEQKDLARYLRDMQADNPRLDLKLAVVRFPWNASDEEVRKYETHAGRVLRSLGLGAKVDARRADHPLVALGRAIAPYIIFAGVVAGVVYFVKRRAEKQAELRAARARRRA